VARGGSGAEAPPLAARPRSLLHLCQIQPLRRKYVFQKACSDRQQQPCQRLFSVSFCAWRRSVAQTCSLHSAPVQRNLALPLERDGLTLHGNCCACLKDAQLLVGRVPGPRAELHFPQPSWRLLKGNQLLERSWVTAKLLPAALDLQRSVQGARAEYHAHVRCQCRLRRSCP